MDTEHSDCCFSVMERNTKLGGPTHHIIMKEGSSRNDASTNHDQEGGAQRLDPRQDPAPVDFEKILQILESIEEIAANTDNCLEPTPLGPAAGIQRLLVTGNFPVTNLLVSNEASIIAEVLYPLLQDGESYNSSSGKRAPEQCKSSFEMYPKKKRQHLVASFRNASVEECEDDLIGRFRLYQSDQWTHRFEELKLFHASHATCLVPHHFPENQQLAQWVKRQRYQHKLKKMKDQSSTLTDEREKALETIGFVWNSHKAAWDERYQSLLDFFSKHGHTKVPSNYEDTSLTIWIKCQRRQYKLFTRGKGSTINRERITMMDSLGFVWKPRNINSKGGRYIGHNETRMIQEKHGTSIALRPPHGKVSVSSCPLL